MEDENTALVMVDELRNQIEQFTTIKECKEGKNKLNAVRVFLMQKHAERDMVQRLNAGSVRLAWKMGKLLKDVLTPGRPAESEDSDQVPRLADFGIGKATSHKYQKISDIPDNLLNSRLERMLAENEDISEKEFYRFARSLDETHQEEEDDDGTDRMDELDQAREQFVAMSREQLAALKQKDIPGVSLLTDHQLELITIGIVETVMEGSGKVKKKIEKFIGENALDETNYWNGMSLISRQIKAVYDSLTANTNPTTPKSLLLFIQNLKSMNELVMTWNPGKMDTCSVCGGEKELPVPEEAGGAPGQTVPCDNCIDGKTGWYKG